MIKHIKYSFILGLVVFVFGCKTAKTVTNGEANLNLNTKQLIKENAKRVATYKTLQSKLKLTLTQKGKTQSYTVTYRSKMDEVIWINAPFSVIRAMITPEKVSFYNKLDNTYFDGDYNYLSDLLGTELDFYKVQNLLIGETIYNLNTSDYEAEVADGNYVVKPKVQRNLFDILFLIDPSILKVKSQRILQPVEQRDLQINYLSHQNINNQSLPEEIKVVAVEENEELIVNLEFKNVVLNEDLRFPFKIPSGFKAIEL
ncbi:deoxyuridine 5'-triphosphate nucleotidohydrolase [Tamlana sedimentorum]|uniref:Deoxyuridine 5'-triphosphate nucleotidohydrolase n=1 Tax=Neotamlana sedimentorum TaxID=1435349 RepID=A0A0D7WCK4_9FLAO|nr:DUF4292 domain-containing protein [Tamlana sedimentorum]KJD36794.1 deoxyuridine 5'-triphosphate nucleotidohydrolase [Tamlana sedimentorum]